MMIVSCLLIYENKMLSIFPGSKLSYQPELLVFSCNNDHPHFVSEIIYYYFKIIHETQLRYRVCIKKITNVEYRSLLIVADVNSSDDNT